MGAQPPLCFKDRREHRLTFQLIVRRIHARIIRTVCCVGILMRFQTWMSAMRSEWYNSNSSINSRV